ncbi:LINE-1 reverse transcriptase [Aphis craccivora]|uniref:LINE-1 reverse transcriptase n=1 Tax=Aphis craccivora TaxID=307492 RepID=A0A6G0ZGQ6_APHCR|nr:LINE-1 reverse transcriptase [Aphis craccivora]
MYIPIQISRLCLNIKPNYKLSLFKERIPEVENYRGISLLNTKYKILALVILNRLQKYSEGIIGDYQSEFRMGRSTIDHIFGWDFDANAFFFLVFAPSNYEYDRDLHMIFVDYKQAYDSIIRKELWRTLAYLGIPKKLITLIQICDADSYSRIQFKNVSSHTFKIENGLRQGEMLCHRRREKEHDRNDESRGSIGLRINTEKTKYMIMTRKLRTLRDITIDNSQIEQIRDFKYLGVTLDKQNNMHGEINTRLAAANKCYFHRRAQDLVKNYILASESSPFILRKIHGPIYSQEEQKWKIRSNNELRALFKRENVVQFVGSTRLEWMGHVWRADGRLLKRVLSEEMEGMRLRGRPCRRRMDSVRETMMELMQSREINWDITAKDRGKWKDLVSAAKSLNGFTNFFVKMKH